MPIISEIFKLYTHLGTVSFYLESKRGLAHSIGALDGCDLWRFFLGKSREETVRSFG